MRTNKLQAILVDDEQSALDNLGYLIGEFCPSVDIIGHAKNVDDAVLLIKNLKPNLVFLDIEMPRKNGFELVKQFKQINFHILFVTAYNHYAVKAFEVSAVDYLLKPIEIDRLKSAVEKVEKQENFQKSIHLLEQNLKDEKIKYLSIPYKNDFIVVDLNDIICIEACRMYSNIIVLDRKTNETKQFLYAKKIGDLERNLSGNTLIRVHRSWLINLLFLKSYSKKRNTVLLEKDFEIPVSRSYKSDLKDFMI